MPRSTIPSYRLHKQSGQAIVTLNGKDHLLGPHGTDASRQRYDRLIAEWVDNGRKPPAPPVELITVVEVITRYWSHALKHYRRADGSQTDEVSSIRQAMAPLRRLFGTSPASEFGPLALKAVRSQMISQGWARSYCNQQAGRIRRMFKWAVENELVPAGVHHGLQAVAGLKRGRSEARESAPVKPVADALVDPLKDHLSRQVWTMIELQRLTGMRPGEVFQMRAKDIDRGRDVWTYRPAQHKNSHHGHDRVVFLGPQARDLLAPFLLRPDDAYLFSPREAEAERRAEATVARTTPANFGNRPGKRSGGHSRQPKREAGDRYDVHSYDRAIARACTMAFPPPGDLARRRVPRREGSKAKRWETPEEWRARLGDHWPEVEAWKAAHHWHPHQLRHGAATRIRRQFGLEAAQVILGHSKADVTQVYAERDAAAAERVVAQVG